VSKNFREMDIGAAQSDSSVLRGQTRPLNPSRVPTLSSAPSGSGNEPTFMGERYALSGERARGGLGRILEARDLRLDRTVAVKELLSRGEEAEARFVREALITARLQQMASPFMESAFNQRFLLNAPSKGLPKAETRCSSEQFKSCRKRVARPVAARPRV